MTKKPGNKEPLIVEFNRIEADDAIERPRRSSARRIRKIHPLGFRVLVKIEKETNVTDAGLYLPEGAKQTMAESLIAEVVEVASATDESDEETNVSGIPMGAQVLIPKDAGVRVPWDETLRLVDTKDILALVDEITLV
jgi:co-chaperonin GroES (HSP10)